jgi:hypothetical protein
MESLDRQIFPPLGAEMRTPPADIPRTPGILSLFSSFRAIVSESLFK